MTESERELLLTSSVLLAGFMSNQLKLRERHPANYGVTINSTALDQLMTLIGQVQIQSNRETKSLEDIKTRRNGASITHLIATQADIELTLIALPNSSEAELRINDRVFRIQASIEKAITVSDKTGSMA